MCIEHGEGTNDGQRHIALCEIVPRRFPDMLRGLPKVQQIIRDLERHAERLPVLRHTRRIIGAHSADHRAELTADLKEVRRLLADALIVCALVLRHLIDRMILEDLPLAQRADELRQFDVNRRIVSFFRNELKRARKDVIPRQDCDLISPFCIRRRSAAPRIRLINDIVMHERGRMNKLQCGRDRHCTCGIERCSSACRNQKERGAQTLPAR